MTRYTVHETFYTFQGEGLNMGRAAYFIRTQGCDQDCPWCDAAGTWHPRWKPTNLRKATAEELIADTQSLPAGAMVVITGGEPCLYDLNPLVDGLIADGFEVAIETAGHRPLPTNDALWITCSPKPFAAHPTPATLQRADEWKVIVSDAASLANGLACIEARNPTSAVWLHPEWGHRNDPNTLRLITEAVKADPTLRAGYQIHKLYRADLADPGARTIPVPLGGTSGDPY